MCLIEFQGPNAASIQLSLISLFSVKSFQNFALFSAVAIPALAAYAYLFASSDVSTFSSPANNAGASGSPNTSNRVTMSNLSFVLSGTPAPLPGILGSPPSKGGVAAASADGVVLSSSTKKVRDPYACLGVIMPDESEHDNEVLNSAWYEEQIRDGGAAMTAYCKLQFTDVADETRRAIEASLKRYCELDTLAMVMIYEAWKSEIDR
jgi:hypothetical protein